MGALTDDDRVSPPDRPAYLTSLRYPRRRRIAWPVTAAISLPPSRPQPVQMAWVTREQTTVNWSEEVLTKRTVQARPAFAYPLSLPQPFQAGVAGTRPTSLPTSPKRCFGQTGSSRLLESLRIPLPGTDAIDRQN